MNILLISRCPPYPLHLGDRLIPYHLAQQLSARGHQIDLIAYYNLPDDTDNVAHYGGYFRSVRLIPEPKRGAAAYAKRLLNRRAFFPRNAAQSWSPMMWNAIHDALTSQHCDFVQLFGGIQVYEFRELVRACPNLIIPYESYSLYLQRLFAQKNSPLRRLAVAIQLTLARRYERAMFDGFGGVVVLSERDADMLRQLNPRLPLHVIPNGVDTDYFAPGTTQPLESENDSALPVLLFVGNFEYAPNADAAIWLARDILPIVQQQVPRTRLLLVGNNPPEAVRLMASDSVEVTGRVHDVRPYQEQALIFVCPLRFGAGIKNKVLEAMAMGKPLVGTRLSFDGIDLVEGTHALFGETARELADAIARLVADDALRHSMSVANRQFVEQRFTWQRVADQYEALYRHIMSQE